MNVDRTAVVEGPAVVYDGEDAHMVAMAIALMIVVPQQVAAVVPLVDNILSLEEKTAHRRPILQWLQSVCCSGMWDSRPPCVTLKLIVSSVIYQDRPALSTESQSPFRNQRLFSYALFRYPRWAIRFCARRRSTGSLIFAQFSPSTGVLITKIIDLA